MYAPDFPVFRKVFNYMAADIPEKSLYHPLP